jgi:molecular chaperone DnaJ
MATQKDLYAVLGVEKSALADDVRKAYRKLARQHHPDLNKGSKQAEERFKEVSLAYDVLGDADKRKLYDEFGPDSLQPGFDAGRAREYQQWARSGRGFAFRPGERPGGAGGAGFEYDFGFGPTRGRRRREEAADERGFADILNDLFGGGGGGAEQPEPPHAVASRDLEHPLEIDFLEALRGTQKSVSIRRPSPCQTCGGTGRQGRRACTTCGGTGSVEKRERLSVKIPPGVGEGARVRVAGKGGTGADGRAGDLYFVVHVRPHPHLKRDGKDLTIEVPITVGEAILGGTITVPTPQGKIQMKVAPGSQSGQRLRVKGRGAPDPKGGTAGDLYVRLMVQVPANGGGEKLREAVSAIEKAYGGDPRANLEV